MIVFPKHAGYNDVKSGGKSIMDAMRKEDIYTIDDIYALPDGERAMWSRIYLLFVIKIKFQIRDAIAHQTG